MPTDINGLKPCPACGTLGKVKVQTPPDDDGIVRRVYFRCFNCMEILTPDFPDWKPVHWQKAGQVPCWPQLRDFYNSEAGR